MKYDYYKSVYYSEVTGKVWRTDVTVGTSGDFEYVGKMNSVEYELLLDILFHHFGERDFTLKDFERHFGDIRTFCDKAKELIEE
jgi:hypothetical protein